MVGRLALLLPALLVSRAAATAPGAVGDAAWQLDEAPPAPPVTPPPALQPCAGVHMTESHLTIAGHNSYRVKLLVHVSSWVPGGQLVLVWEPIWASAKFNHIEGAQLLTREDDYGAAERSTLSDKSDTAVSVLQLSRARYASPNCHFSDPSLSGAACA